MRSRSFPVLPTVFSLLYLPSVASALCFHVFHFFVPSHLAALPVYIVAIAVCVGTPISLPFLASTWGDVLEGILGCSRRGLRGGRHAAGRGRYPILGIQDIQHSKIGFNITHHIRVEIPKVEGPQAAISYPKPFPKMSIWNKC